MRVLGLLDESPEGAATPVAIPEKKEAAA